MSKMKPITILDMRHPKATAAVAKIITREITGTITMASMTMKRSTRSRIFPSIVEGWTVIIRVAVMTHSVPMNYIITKKTLCPSVQGRDNLPQRMSVRICPAGQMIFLVGLRM